MPHKYRAAIGRESLRPAEVLLLSLSRGVEIADGQFRLPRDGKRKKQFLHTFVCLQKYVAAGHSTKKVLPAHRQTYFRASMRRNNFPDNNTRVPRRSAFWPKPLKGAKTLFNPRRQAKNTCGIFRRRRINWGEIPFSSCNWVRQARLR